MDNPARYYSAMNNLRPERGGRGQKYWFACWVDDSGARRRKALGAKVKSKAAARRACNDLLSKAATHGAEYAMPGKAPSVMAWLRTYLKQRSEYSETTTHLYRQAAALLAKHAGEPITTVEEHDAAIIAARSGDKAQAATIRKMLRLDQVTRQTAAEFRQWIQDGRTETTVRKIIRTLRAMFAEAVRQDVSPINPFDRQTGTTPEVEQSWTYLPVDDFERILDACPDTAWRAFFALARYGGLRLNESCRLSFADIDWNRRTFIVRNPGRSKTTKHRTRIVPLSPPLYAELRQRFEDAEPGESVVRAEYVKFGRKSGTARKAMNAIIDRAGVDDYGKRYHALRMSLQTDWLKSHPIADVCKWLGNSPAVAMKHYHQTTDETMSKVSQPPPSGDAGRIAELEAELARLKT